MERLDKLPIPLKVSVSLLVVQSCCFVMLAILELVKINTERVAMGITSALFFLLFGLGMLLAAWGLSKLAVWGRSPALFGQFILLGVAFSFRGGSTWLVALILAAVAMTVIFGILNKASMAALADSH